MPTGIILASASQGATQEAVEKVLTANGYEADKPEPAAGDAPVEPKREDFDSDEDFAEAKETFDADAEETEAAAAEEKEREEEEKRPKLTRKQRAIDRATRELKEENRKMADRLAVLEGGKKPAAEQPKIEVPKRDQFKSDAEFEEAMFDYRYKVRRAKEDYENAQKANQNQLKETLDAYQAGVAEFKDEHDDWDDVVNQSIPVHESVVLAVMEQENGPAVTYYLGKHPDYTRKLADMKPLSAVMEVGRLSARLKTGARTTEREAGSRPKPKTKSRLPEPVKPVSTAATSSTLSSSEAAKSRNFRAFKAAQRAGR